MYDNMKYIIVTNAMGVEVPVVFSDSFQHNDVYYAMKERMGVELVSAGFTHHASDGVICYGKSVTLDKGMRVEDAALISKHLGADDLINEAEKIRE